jgi:putative transposase
VDSQSAKTTGVGGEQRGYDGGKKVRGRKRHILVDTEGLVLEAKVHSAMVPDEDGIKLLMAVSKQFRKGNSPKFAVASSSNRAVKSGYPC